MILQCYIIGSPDNSVRSLPFVDTDSTSIATLKLPTITLDAEPEISAQDSVYRVLIAKDTNLHDQRQIKAFHK